MTPSPAPYDVRAFNQAAASENKIHDDAVAQRFGFKGALVPGVTVFAYMAHQPVARWGRAWLEGGAAECRFRKPVYDGEMVHVSAASEGALRSVALSRGDRIRYRDGAPGYLGVQPFDHLAIKLNCAA